MTPARTAAEYMRRAGYEVRDTGGGKMKAILDRAMGRLASRKLWAWLAATGALFAGQLDGASWVTVTVVYIGSQAAVDVAERLRR